MLEETMRSTNLLCPPSGWPATPRSPLPAQRRSLRRL